MVQQTSGREKEKGIGQSTIAHMASERLIVNFVVEIAFVTLSKNKYTCAQCNKGLDKVPLST